MVVELRRREGSKIPQKRPRDNFDITISGHVCGDKTGYFQRALGTSFPKPTKLFLCLNLIRP